jgi:hypothetical protein
MGIDADDFETLKRLDVLEQDLRRRAANARPLHPRVHFQMDAALFSYLFASFGDEIGFEFRADGEFEVKADQVEDLVFMDRPQDEDRDRDAGLAQLHPFL